MDNVVPTVEEVDSRYDSRRDMDMLGFEVDEYVVYMSFDKIRSIAKEEANDDDINGLMRTLSHDGMLETMLGYMEFAWGKANGMRGISASRSIAHYIAWTWLAGDAEFSAKIESDDLEGYCYYGKPILESICEFYGWDWKVWDNGVRTNG